MVAASVTKPADSSSIYFQVQQKHFKRAPKTVHLLVGAMNLTLFDGLTTMRPVASFLYEHIAELRSSPQDVTISTRDRDRPGKPIVEVVLNTAEGPRSSY